MSKKKKAPSRATRRQARNRRRNALLASIYRDIKSDASSESKESASEILRKVGELTMRDPQLQKQFWLRAMTDPELIDRMEKVRELAMSEYEEEPLIQNKSGVLANIPIPASGQSPFKAIS